MNYTKFPHQNEVKLRYFVHGYKHIHGENHLWKQTKFTEISPFLQKLLNKKIQKTRKVFYNEDPSVIQAVQPPKPIICDVGKFTICQ